MPCSDRDGRVTLHDLAALAEQARMYARQHAPHECQAQLQGACTLRLYWDVAKSGGTNEFVSWCGASSALIKLLLEHM